MSRPNGKTEAFSRVVIDAQLEDVDWDLKDGQSVRYEYSLPVRCAHDDANDSVALL